MDLPEGFWFLWVPNASLTWSLHAVFWACPPLVTECLFPGGLFAHECAKRAHPPVHPAKGTTCTLHVGSAP